MACYSRIVALVGIVCAVVVTAPSALAQSADLTKLTLEDLLGVEVTSVSKKEQTLRQTAAAVYVITQEDIRRSGATTIPDLLRLVPGFNVGQVDETAWAVGARGFAGIYANKLLVLLDGRSVYVPLFSGVYWDLLNVSFADIDRIEVIRGPGGTIWGANAVNGVVNIITKTADATQGGRASAGGGTDNRGVAEARYGGQSSARSFYRLFGKYSDRERTHFYAGVDQPVDGSLALGGGRFDWRGDVDRLSVHGSVQKVDTRHVYIAPDLAALRASASTVNLDTVDGSAVLLWSRAATSRRQNDIQTSFQQYRRESGPFTERWRILDVDARQRRMLGDRHDVMAGVGYRYSALETSAVSWLYFEGPKNGLHLYTGFIQDEIVLSRTLRITPGTKLEHHHASGFQLQPSVRATWSPDQQHTVWGAVSRAVRTPSVTDQYVRFAQFVPAAPGSLPIVTEVRGNPDVASETLHAYEAGYRLQAGTMWLDATAFRNQYDRLMDATPGQPAVTFYDGSPVIRVPLDYANRRTVQATGVEVATTWQPTTWWKTTGSTAWLHTRAPLAPGTNGESSVVDGAVPRWQFHVRTYVDLPGRLDASALYFDSTRVGALPIDRRHALNLRLGWRPTARVDFAAGIQNLFHDAAIESADLSTGMIPVPVRTTPFAEVTWTF